MTQYVTNCFFTNRYSRPKAMINHQREDLMIRLALSMQHAQPQPQAW